MDFKLVMGLGNPGPEYANTYHNAGLAFVDRFARSRDVSFSAMPGGEGRWGSYAGVRFLEPEVFMNESGRAAAAALSYYRIPPSRFLAVHDDIDLEIGTYRFSFGRGSAGHKGVESVIAGIATKDFWRLRIGIAPAPGTVPGAAARPKAGSVVLSPISAAHRVVLDQVFSELENVMKKLIEKDTP